MRRELSRGGSESFPTRPSLLFCRSSLPLSTATRLVPHQFVGGVHQARGSLQRHRSHTATRLVHWHEEARNQEGQFCTLQLGTFVVAFHPHEWVELSARRQSRISKCSSYKTGVGTSHQFQPERHNSFRRFPVRAVESPLGRLGPSDRRPLDSPPHPGGTHRPLRTTVANSATQPPPQERIGDDVRPGNGQHFPAL